MIDPNSGLVIIGAVFAIFGVFSTLVLWMMSRVESRLHNDITSVSNRLEAAIARMDANTAAMNARVDASNVRMAESTAALNARVDTTQGILMRMLEKSSKIG
jgi:predicted PurR-regulated permease PerM